MDEEQFAEATKGTTAQYDCNARQVQNGYVLNGQIRYVDNVTGVVRLSKQLEAIASTAEGAGDTLNRFLLNGTFAA